MADNGMQYTCDQEMQSLYCEPLYNIAWFMIKKEGKPYCLVPVPDKDKIRDALDRVDELLLILNQHTRFWKGSWNQPSQGQPAS